MQQVPFTVTPGGVQVAGLPEGARIVSVPLALAKEMADMRLHANDFDLALQAVNQAKADTPEFSIVNFAVFSVALVSYFRCFKGSGSRESLDPATVYADVPEALAVHKFFEGIRDKHVAHDENNYFTAIPFAILVGNEPVTRDRVVVGITHASMDREPAYIEQLRGLAFFCRTWAEGEADRLTAELAEVLNVMPRREVEQWPAPQLTFPRAGDERQKRHGLGPRAPHSSTAAAGDESKGPPDVA